MFEFEDLDEKTLHGLINDKCMEEIQIINALDCLKNLHKEIPNNNRNDKIKNKLRMKLLQNALAKMQTPQKEADSFYF